jgi:hypothetical protein
MAKKQKLDYCACDTEYDCAIAYACSKNEKGNCFHLGFKSKNPLVRCRRRRKGENKPIKMLLNLEQ